MRRRRILLLLGAAVLVGASVGLLAKVVLPRTSAQPQTVAVTSSRHDAGVLHHRTRQRYAPLVRRGSAASFAALEARLPGLVGLSVTPLANGALHSFGRAQVALAWSTSKVPVLVTLLSDYEQGRGSLDAREREDATLALEQSDNAAIDALFARLEQLHGGLVGASLAIQRVLRRSGDKKTIVNTAPNNRGFTTEGQTDWSVHGEVFFYRALAQGCLLNTHDTRYVLGLMRNVVSSERWGIGSAGYPSTVRLAFKGGWGPDNLGRYQVRQTGIVSSQGHGYVLALLALPGGGSFADGTSMVTTLAKWAKQHLNLNNGLPQTVHCGR
jgi:hypothetical protein